MEKSIQNKRVAIIGMGFVGLSLALVLSELGFKVFGVEKKEEVVEGLRKGRAHFYEPGINEMIAKELNNGLEFVTELEKALADVYILAIGTPVEGPKKIPNFNDLKGATEAIAEVLKPGDMVILRSTVPPGTTRDIVIPILEDKTGLKCGKDFHVIFAPERTVEGKAIEELRELPQVVGADVKESRKLATAFFGKMTKTVVPLRSFEGAEMVKLINNLYRDISFAFANEIALACDKFNLDSYEVIDAANHEYRRSAVPKPSPGVGGYCLTKDPHILRYAVNQKGMDLKMIWESRNINKYMPHYVAGQVYKFLESEKRNIKDAKVFILGLAFKGDPPTSDFRYSPSIKLARILRDKPMKVQAYDPLVGSQDYQEEGIDLVSLEDGFRDADAVVITTNHPDFKKMDIAKYLISSKKPVFVFDGWKLHDREKLMQITSVRYSNLGFDNI